MSQDNRIGRAKEDLWLRVLVWRARVANRCLCLFIAPRRGFMCAGEPPPEGVQHVSLHNVTESAKMSFLAYHSLWEFTVTSSQLNGHVC